MELLQERLAEAGLSSASKEAVDTRLGGGGEEADEIGLLAARLSLDWVHELCDTLVECGGPACVADVCATEGISERELLALVLALQQRGGAIALAAFRLHVASASHARLHALVLVGFVRACRALNGGSAKGDRRAHRRTDANADADEPSAPAPVALVATLRALRDALRSADPLPADPALSVAEGVCELLRSGALGDDRACADDAFDVLGCLLPEHAQAVFRALVPMIALTLDGASSTAVSRRASALQNGAVRFACDALAAAGGDDDSHGSGAVLDAALALVQHAITSTPDKADFRSAVSTAAGAIAACMPDAYAARYVDFGARLGRVAKQQHRLMACELALDVLGSSALSHVDRAALADVLLAGARDKSTSVRARAVAAVGALVERSGDDRADADGTCARALELLEACAAERPDARVDDLMVAAVAAAGASSLALSPESGAHDVRRAERAAAAGATSAWPALRRALVRRCRDAKPVVRRAAVSALGALALAADADGAVDGDGEAVESLSARCRDTSLAVRKSAAAALGTLASRAAERCAPVAAAAECVGSAWLAAVAPLVADGEASVREQSCGALCAGLLAPLAAKGAPERAALAWRVLASCDRNTAEHLRCACAALARAPNALPRGLCAALQGAVHARAAPDGEPLTPAARAAAWAMLEELAASKPHAKDMRAAELVAEWTGRHTGAPRAAPRSTDDVDALGSLHVVVQLSRAKLLPRAACEALVPGLRAVLVAERPSPQLARAVAHAYAAASAAVGVAPAAAWAEVVARCERALCAGARAHARCDGSASDAAGGGSADAGCTPLSGRGTDETLFLAFLAGEVGLLCPPHTATGEDVLPDRLVRALEAEAVPPRADASARARAGSPAALVDSERVALQAQAIVALGKLAASRAALGKRLVPMLVSELHESSCAAVRNNCLFVLADLLTHLTALVDRHVPLLALTMADEEPLVRYHSVVLVTRLLLSDFVRWKPLMLRAFARALVDGEERVRTVTAHCLVEQLLPRAPHMAAQHVVELLAHLNGCSSHAAFARSAALTAAQEARLQLAGPANRERRGAICAALFRDAPDDARLAAFHKLCAEILAPAADGSLQLGAAGAAELIADALLLLGSRALRLTAPRAAGGADADDCTLEEIGGTVVGGGAAAPMRAAGAARAKLAAVASAKLCAEGVLPVAIELRRALEHARSPLLGLLMAFVRELVRGSRELLADLGERDAEFAAEIEFDLRAHQPARGAASADVEPADVADVADAHVDHCAHRRSRPAHAARAQPMRRRAALKEHNEAEQERAPAPAASAVGDAKRARKGLPARAHADVQTPRRAAAA